MTTRTQRLFEAIMVSLLLTVGGFMVQGLPATQYPGLGTWVVDVMSRGEQAQAGKKPAPNESLVNVLQRIDKLDKLMEPFPLLDTLDPIYQFDATTRNHYKRYLKKVAPLYDHLMEVYAVIDATEPDQQVNLQMLSANAHYAELLWGRVTPFLTEEEAKYNSAKLMERTVANLHETVEYWRQRNQSQSSFRTNKWNEGEDNYVLQTKILAARESLAELQRMGALAGLLESGFVPQEGSQ
jgi:hypothetical protein